MPKVIVVEDDPQVRSVLARILGAAGHTVTCAVDIAGFQEAVRSSNFDVALLDIGLPDGRGDSVIQEILERDPHLHVIVISGRGELDDAVAAMKRGAFDYLAKPFSPDTLVHVVSQALTARARAVEKTAAARNTVRSASMPRRLVGTSAAICAANLMISHAAGAANTPVLIGGESGTGKELAAQAIHEQSTRRDHPLIRINCSAIPRPLVESELFGHEKGAFTDARETRKGLFELADGGTVFLDEIGELDIAVQPKLLRVLEDKTVVRVGGHHERKVDIRVVAATNRDLQAMCARREFRDDLYFRLAVMNIQLPALREHTEDIPALANLFLMEKCAELGRNVTGFSEKVMDFFLEYSWPGNVRELRNMVERLIILADSDRIELDSRSLKRYCFQTPSNDFDFGIETALRAGRSGVMTPPPPARVESAQVVTLDVLEKNYILGSLDHFGWNKTLCARSLGISRSTLQRKLATYGIDDQLTPLG